MSDSIVRRSIPAASLRRLLAWALVVGMTPTGVVHAATLNVAAGAVLVAADSVCSLREAIDNANDAAATHPDCAAGSGSDIVALAAGSTYTLPDGPYAADGDNGLPSITGTLTLDANGSILERDPSADDFRILRVASGANFTLEDATVRNGRATAASGFSNRGGGLLDRGTSTIRNSTFTDNFAENGGAIAYGSSATATIHDSSIVSNDASDSGGGIFNGEPHTVQIFATTIAGNTAVNGGGAIATFHIVETSCTTITGNTAAFGGGMYLATTGRASVIGSTVADNDATGATSFTGNGGGIYASGSNLNATGSDGLQVVDSTISGNRATRHGGGIYGFAANIFLFSATIAGNRADSDNDGTGTGGGVANDGTSFSAGMATFQQPGRVNFGNALLADNSDDGNGANDCVDLQLAPLTTQFVSYGNNLVEDPAGCAITELVGIGTNVLGQDPGLPPLTLENGACTATQCAANGPAIDGGAASLDSCAGGVNSVITVDQRGLPRPVGGVCDIGACERQVPLDPSRSAPTAATSTLAALCLLLGGLGVRSLRRA
jgi:hypothetical protein